MCCGSRQELPHNAKGIHHRPTNGIKHFSDLEQHQEGECVKRRGMLVPDFQKNIREAVAPLELSGRESNGDADQRTADQVRRIVQAKDKSRNADNDRRVETGPQSNLR